MKYIKLAQKTVLRWGLLFCIFGVVSGVIPVSGGMLQAEEVESIYYFVNDDIISKTDFEREYSVFLKQPIAGNFPGEAGREYVISNQVLDLLIEQKLQEEGLAVSELDVSNQVMKIMTSAGVPTLRDFKFSIEQSLKVSYEDYLNTVLRKLNQGVFFQKLIPVVPPSKQEIEDYYQENEKDFEVSDPLYNLSLLVLESPRNATFSQRRKVEAEIREIKEKITAGEMSFIKAVGEYSQDLTTKNKQGLLGWVNSADRIMSPNQMKAIAKLEKGGVSTPVAVIGGVGLYYLNDKKTSGAMPLEVAYKLIWDKLMTERKKVVGEKVVADLYRLAYVKKNTQALSYQP